MHSVLVMWQDTLIGTKPEEDRESKIPCSHMADNLNLIVKRQLIKKNVGHVDKEKVGSDGKTYSSVGEGVEEE